MTSLLQELRKLKPSAVRTRRRIVRIGRRLLLVSWWDDLPRVIRGTVIPLSPWHLDGTSEGILIQTIATFKISHVDSEWEICEVQNISVVDKHQRRGWGMNLVEALIKTFPGRQWAVSAPNEKSSALFAKLHTEHPNEVARPPLGRGTQPTEVKP